MTFSISNFITLLGLAFDVLGAWYISRGLMRKSEEDLEQETGFSFAPNDNYIIGGLSQKVECNVGFTFLLFGFTLQGLSSLLTDRKLTDDLPVITAILIFIVCIFVILTSYLISERLIRKKVSLYIKNHVEHVVEDHIKYSGDTPMHINDIKRHLSYLKVSYKDNISHEEAWNKLKDETLSS